MKKAMVLLLILMIVSPVMATTIKVNAYERVNSQGDYVDICLTQTVFTIGVNWTRAVFKCDDGKKCSSYLIKPLEMEYGEEVYYSASHGNPTDVNLSAGSPYDIVYRDEERNMWVHETLFYTLTPQEIEGFDPEPNKNGFVEKFLTSKGLSESTFKFLAEDLSKCSGHTPSNGHSGWTCEGKPCILIQ